MYKAFKAVLALLVTFAITIPAVAVDVSWDMAMVGPADNKVVDGSVDGYRLGIGTDTDTPQPRVVANFDSICPDLTAGTNELRVAVVIDFGDQTQAPEGETAPESKTACVVVPAGSSSADALAKAAEIRSESGLICGIDGFPATECAAEATVGDITGYRYWGFYTSDPSADPVPISMEAEAVSDVEESSNLLLWAVLTLAVTIFVFVTIRRRLSKN